MSVQVSGQIQIPYSYISLLAVSSRHPLVPLELHALLIRLSPQSLKCNCEFGSLDTLTLPTACSSDSARGSFLPTVVLCLDWASTRIMWDNLFFKVTLITSV